jgi:hypothetical protein
MEGSNCVPLSCAQETGMPERRTAAKPIHFRSEEHKRITAHTQVPSGLPPWLQAFVHEAAEETDALRLNGAEQAAAAITALLKKLIDVAKAWLETELDPHAASGRARNAPNLRGALGLIAQWRTDAALLRQYRNHQQAEWLEDRGAELEAVLEGQNGDLVSLVEGARLSGYTADHLGRLVRRGVLQNFGRLNAPKVRRGDLPRKLTLPGRHANPQLVGASKRQVAQAILTSKERR